MEKLDNRSGRLRDQVVGVSTIHRAHRLIYYMCSSSRRVVGSEKVSSYCQT